MKIRTVLIEPHRAYSAGVRLSLPADVIEVVGEGRSASGAGALVDSNRPDVVVIPYRLPDSDGVRLAKVLIDLQPGLKLVMLSGVLTENVIVAAIRAGVRGLVSKFSATEHIPAAVLAVSLGNHYLCPDSCAIVFSHLIHRPLRGLSARELDVLRMVSLGKQNKEIAAELRLSPATIKGYRKTMMRKLGANNVVEVIGAAARMGLLDEAQQE